MTTDCLICRRLMDARLKAAQKLEKLERKLNLLAELAAKQQKDPELWVTREMVSINGVISVQPTTVMEARLQRALRQMHSTITRT